MRRLLIALIVACLPASASALGALATADGTEASIDASRTVIIHGGESTQVITQIKYDGAPSGFAWVLPIPDGNPDEGVVINSGFGQGGLDALEAATRPTFEGACDETPNGETGEFLFREAFGPQPPESPGQRIFRRAELDAAKSYITDTLGYTLSDSLSGAMDAVADRNYMFVVLNVPLGAVERVDPIVSATYPAGDGNPQLSLRVSAADLGGNDRVDMLFWVVDRNRVRGNLTTRPVDFEPVSFVSPLDTNYDEVFEDTVDALQSQALVVEYAAQVGGGFGDAELDALLDGQAWVTRLRARFQEAALRNNAATLSFRADDDPTEYAREHVITGSDCGGPPMPDMGMMGEADMEVGEADMGMGDAPDMATGGDADGGADTDGGAADGGGDGGGGSCALSAGRTSTPFLISILFLLGFGALRRRA